MNTNKICFITCVSSEEKYAVCVMHIKSLHIPEGIEIEIKGIRGASSMAEGYNSAMKGSDAKYKVYLHDDTFIINNDFISDTLNIFQSAPDIGMIGAVGSNTLPSSGVWWESTHRYGKIYESHTGTMGLLSFEEVLKDYLEVKAVDGLLMITQYDLTWRDDIFNGWFFYDIAQCVEFHKAGYKVAIPSQKDPWYIHDCGIVNVPNEYEKYRSAFLAEYSSTIFPLVSLIIPTYNRPDYFKIALSSAVSQTYKNTEIIICDNSINRESQEICKQYMNNFSNIRYYKNETVLDRIVNFNKGLDLARGEYAEFLMDDDVYRIDKTERMMNYFLEYDDISLVTSSRQPIDKDGNFLTVGGALRRLFDRDVIIEGNAFISNFIMESLENVIGEPTTPLFKLEDVKGRLGILKGRQFIVITDLITWLNTISKGRLVYISEPLSYFRLHSLQGQNSIATSLNGSMELYFLHKEFCEINTWDDQKYNNSLSRIKNIFQYTVQRAGKEVNVNDTEESEALKNFQLYYNGLFSK